MSLYECRCCLGMETGYPLQTSVNCKCVLDSCTSQPRQRAFHDTTLQGPHTWLCCCCYSTSPPHPPPLPHLGNSCGYLYRWSATEKMRSGQGERQQKTSNERSPEVLREPWADAESVWQAEARAIILPGLLQNYMQLLMIKHFVRQC